MPIQRFVLCVALLSGFVVFCGGTPRADAQVVINEIHYEPPDVEPGEFIELYNAGQDTVDLSGWSFTDGVLYTFDAGTTRAAGAFLLLAEDPSYLQSRFDDTALDGATVLGPYTGRLSNQGERLELRKYDPVLRRHVIFKEER